MLKQKEPIRLQEGEHYTIGRMAWLMAEAEYPKAISASNQRVVFIATIQAKNGSMRTREPDDMRAISELWQRCGLPELFPAGEYPRFVPTGFDLAPYNDALNSEHWKHDWRPLLCDSTTNRSCRARKAMYQYPRTLRDEAVAGAFTAFTDDGVRARLGTSQELFVSAKEAARYLQDVRGYTVILEAAEPRQDTETLPTQKLDYKLLATPEKLINAFGAFTGMDKKWFRNLKDKPALFAARKCLGRGGKEGYRIEPLFCPLEVMQWLTDPKRKTGRHGATPDKCWRLLKSHFPDVYNANSVQSPLRDD